MEEHYPDFKKSDMPWTKENRENYSKLLFYEVPDYYYLGETGTLTYSSYDYEDSVYMIKFRSSDDGGLEFYYIETP